MSQIITYKYTGWRYGFRKCENDDDEPTITLESQSGDQKIMILSYQGYFATYAMCKYWKFAMK